MLSLKLPLNLPSELQSVPFVDISTQLPINPHYNWAELAGVRKQEDLTVIVSHHDAWPKHISAKFNDLQLAQKIAQDHIDSKKNHATGDAGFPYDLWIRNGSLYLCNDILAREYGVASNNGYTVNICVSGDYVNYDSLTDPDRNALYLGMLMLKAIMPNFKSIKGHKEISATSCPGYEMEKVRSDMLTIEIKMNQSATWKDRVSKCNRINSQINYMDSLIAAGETDGKALWAIQRKEAIYKIMDGLKLL